MKSLSRLLQSPSLAALLAVSFAPLTADAARTRATAEKTSAKARAAKPPAKSTPKAAVKTSAQKPKPPVRQAAALKSAAPAVAARPAAAKPPKSAREIMEAEYHVDITLPGYMKLPAARVANAPAAARRSGPASLSSPAPTPNPAAKENGTTVAQTPAAPEPPGNPLPESPDAADEPPLPAPGPAIPPPPVRKSNGPALAEPPSIPVPRPSAPELRLTLTAATDAAQSMPAAAQTDLNEQTPDTPAAGPGTPVVVLTNTAAEMEGLDMETRPPEPEEIIPRIEPAPLEPAVEEAAGGISVPVSLPANLIGASEAAVAATDLIPPPLPKQDLLPQPSIAERETILLKEIASDRELAGANPLMPTLDVEPQVFTAAATDDADLPEQAPAIEQTPRRAENLARKVPLRAGPKTGAIDIVSDGRTDYDEKNSRVLFTGEVQLSTQRFRLRADKLTVIMKPGTQELQSAVATGEVVVELTPENREPAFGQAGKAVYNPVTGEITLTDWPKIQEATKSHIASEAGTKMFLYTDGRMRTEGANRTIFQ